MESRIVSIGLIAIALTTLTITLLSYWLAFGSSFSELHSNWAEFGEYFGGIVSPVVSLCALFALLQTMNEQSAMLQIAKHEQVQSRTILAAIADAALLDSVARRIKHLEHNHFAGSEDSAELSRLYAIEKSLRDKLTNPSHQDSGP